jgi:integrase/recombinase XerC
MSAANEAAFRGLARQLRVDGRSPVSAVGYHSALMSLADFLAVTGRNPDLLSVTRADAGDWITELRERGGWSARGGALAQRGKPLAPDTLATYFGVARRFYNWAAAEALIAESPIARMTAPRPADKPVPVPDAALVRAMIATTAPKRGARRPAMDIRDELIIRLFAETGGPRCAELAGTRTEALDLRRDVLRIERGKGGRARVIALSAATAMAGQRWLAVRGRYPGAQGLPWLLLGRQGQLATGGVYKVVVRRAAMAGGQMHPHQLRHFAADRAKAAEMPDGDIMTLFGWSTTAMLGRYGKARAQARALESSRRHALGDQL